MRIVGVKLPLRLSSHPPPSAARRGRRQRTPAALAASPESPFAAAAWPPGRPRCQAPEPSAKRRCGRGAARGPRTRPRAPTATVPSFLPPQTTDCQVEQHPSATSELPAPAVFRQSRGARSGPPCCRPCRCAAGPPAGRSERQRSPGSEPSPACRRPSEAAAASPRRRPQPQRQRLRCHTSAKMRRAWRCAACCRRRLHSTLLLPMSAASGRPRPRGCARALATPSSEWLPQRPRDAPSAFPRATSGRSPPNP
mmetsp:Transcript_151988/g.487948  ORF Transcript_151988/g.487948 Transcript_151988/m.487948 type:complete len:253 (-) Transcript_151988:239-997(-)